MTSSNCKRCGAQIQWARSANGIAMPLDLEKSDGGNIELVEGIAVVVSGEKNVKRLTPHFATCKEASRGRVAR